MKRFWEVWKHSLGAFDEEDGYDPINENLIAIIRTSIVMLNIICGLLICANIIFNWGT